MTLQELAVQVSQKLYHASNLFQKGRATADQFLRYVIRQANATMKAAPMLNPSLKPQHIDETPEGLANLERLAQYEVSDEDLNAPDDGEAPESIDFAGGGQFDADI